MIKLKKYSMGIGDRFGLQGNFQLEAFAMLRNKGIAVTPVWNKSHREHLNTHTTPESVRNEALQAVAALNWNLPFHIDADHITMDTVSGYVEHADFFTIDVAREIQSPGANDGSEESIDAFSRISHPDFLGSFSRDYLMELHSKYQTAVREASRIYRFIQDRKKDFITEISMDEVPHYQSPRELYFILFLLAHHGIRIQTIAPKFPGRFNKGVDYDGSTDEFSKHFENYLLAVRSARENFNMEEELKLSIHTGSDKFSLYPVMGRLIRKHNMGIHLKTAGTTWLEEVIGLAEAGETDFVCRLYAVALDRFDELTANYDQVLNIDRDQLPSCHDLSRLNGASLAAVIRHDKDNPGYDPNVRQLLHTAYKIAAEQIDEYSNLVKVHAALIGRGVRDNILHRHLLSLFA